MKPILYNTEMVRGLLNGTKTVTRRVVKPQHLRVLDSPYHKEHPETPDKVLLQKLCEPPYHPGDILYVRETWRLFDFDYIDGNWSANVSYKADCGIGPRLRYLPHGSDERCGWRPAIHMPREAARIFLRVTDIKVQRVQDITDEEAQKEGVKGWMVAADRDWDKNPNFVIAFRHVWNNCYSKPQPVKVKGVIDHYESYPWEDIQETRTYRGKPWYVIGDSWTWAIEFERCEKP